MNQKIKSIIFVSLLLCFSYVKAQTLEEIVTCSLSKIEQGYPDDSIPSVGEVEFSSEKIKVPVQFYGNRPEIWESSLTKAVDGTFYGNHFWNIRLQRNEINQVKQISMEFERPSNLGLSNEESTYLAELYCWPKPKKLSDTEAASYVDEYVQKTFPGLNIEFRSLKVFLESDGCNSVTRYSSEIRVCDKSQQYVGSFFQVKVCQGVIKSSNFYCDDY